MSFFEKIDFANSQEDLLGVLKNFFKLKTGPIQHNKRQT